jgi:carbon storage regulator CsrA
MLVLTRKVGQEIRIEGGITICVVSIKGKQVQLAVAAPDGVLISRPEAPEARKAVAPVSKRMPG